MEMGIRFSSFADRIAEQMYSENNALYMTGRAEYMKKEEIRELILHKKNYEFILGIDTDKNKRTEHDRSTQKSSDRSAVQR